MDKKDKVPAIRFSGFTDAWEQRKVGSLASDTYGGGTPSTSKDEYWNGSIPWIQSSDLTEHQVTGVSPRKLISKTGIWSSATKLVPENSLAIITRVGVGKLAVMPFPYTTSQDFLSLSKLKIDVWFGAYLLYKKLQSELNSVQGTSIKGITKDELLAKVVSVPEHKEQEAVGNYFKILDNLITLHQRKLSRLENIKKGMLEKLFPKEGSVYPEVCFSGFSDAWEQRKLSDTFVYLRNNSLSRAELNYEKGSIKNIHYGDILVKFGEVLDMKTADVPFVSSDEFTVGRESLLQDGDVIIADAAEDETVGKCSEIRGIDSINVVSGLHTIPCRPNWKFAPGYLGYYLNSTSYHDQLLPLMQGTKVSSISKPALLSTNIIYPGLEEQLHIGKFFTGLDYNITLHQRKLEKLQNIKKALLDKMFV